ncbi:MAG TPA: two-component system response regulator, partial [Ochrobactrum sp.]|nr:two-component system response regulator [Ochrobactrum sp.]
MIVVVDDRDIVTEGYSSWFGREGITTTGFTPTDFDEWVESVPQQDIMAVEAFLIGECADQHRLPARIRERCKAPVIAVNDRPSL